MVGDWYGENPYYLLCVSGKTPIATHMYLRIDLDEPGWAAKNEEWMRNPGEWHLVRKSDDGVALSLKVLDGEQPYYTSRVFGNNKTASLIRSWGIGKKQHDGSMMRLWILENGQICGGDDVDLFGPELL